MKTNEINPFVRYLTSGMWMKRGTNWTVAADCRLIYVKNNKGKIETNDGIIAFEGDTAIIIPADTPYSLSYVGSPFGYICIDFDFSQMHSGKSGPVDTADEKTYLKLKIIEACQVEEFSSVILVENTSCTTLVDMLVNEYEKSGVEKYAGEMASAFLKELLFKLLRLNNAKRTKTTDLVDGIRHFMNKHINEKLDNNEIAEVFGYHPYYLSRVFKDITGMTMHKFFLSVKCERAEKLLNETDMSVNDIAKECGFDSQSHFSGTFQKINGLSPTDYRKSKRR